LWLPASGSLTDPSATSGTSNFGLAMILVLYTYGGWNDAAFVAAEQTNRRRNIPLALILGTLLITLIYVLVNAAYLSILGFDQIIGKRSEVAADVLEKFLGGYGSKAMCLLVMVSALGAINGMIFTGSRIYSALGSEHTVFAWLGKWSPRLGSPLWSLAAQCVITLLMLAAVGTATGQDVVNQILGLLRFETVNWNKVGEHGGFDGLLTATAPIFWLFFMATGFSLFVLREKDRSMERPFSVPLYPLLPFIFCNMCAYMLYSATVYAVTIGLLGVLTLLGVAPLLAGVPLYFVSKRNTVSNA